MLLTYREIDEVVQDFIFAVNSVSVPKRPSGLGPRPENGTNLLKWPEKFQSE
jgi:hypothetical protein